MPDSKIQQAAKLGHEEVKRVFGGLAHLKVEGAPAHPDGYTLENGDELSDEWYLRQLKAYAEWRGMENTKQEMCERPYLLDELGGKDNG